MKRVLLIGGAGFIGSAIAKELVKIGKEVIIYDAFLNFISPLDSDYEFFLKQRFKNIRDKVTVVRGDVRVQKRLMRLMKEYNPDAVIHLAAVADAKAATVFPEEATTINIDGTLRILESLKESKSVKKFIFASSSFVYGDFVYHPADEKHRLNPIDVYGATKITGEILTKAYCRNFNIDWVIIRPSAVYGFGDANRRVTKIMVENALRGKPLVLHDGGKARVDFTCITDTAHGFVLALTSDKAKNETFNITRGEGRTIEDLSGVVCQYIRGVKVISKPLDVVRPQRGALDITKAREMLGYEPKYSLEEGIKKYIEDYQTLGSSII